MHLQQIVIFIIMIILLNARIYIPGSPVITIHRQRTATPAATSRPPSSSSSSSWSN